MYGLTTLAELNRKNAEAARIQAAHAVGTKPDPTDTVSHKPTMFAPTAKIDQILAGARG